MEEKKHEKTLDNFPLKKLFFMDLSKDLWESFNSAEPLFSKENYKLMYLLSEEIKLFLISQIKKDEINKIKWIIISLWDFFKESSPKFEVLLFSLNNKDGGIEFINPFRKEGDNFSYEFEDASIWMKEKWPETGFDNIYLEYSKWIFKEFNEQRIKKVHFWDFVHSFKRFIWPYVITKESYSNSLGEVNTDILRIIIKDKIIYKQDISPKINNSLLWDWGFFKNILDKNEIPKDIFEEILRQYYDKLSEGVGAKYIYEFPIMLNTEEIQKKFFFQSVATVSLGTSEPINYHFWEYLIYSHVKSYLQIFLPSSFISRFKVNSLKSAIASIMSRNMSHNIGSHVLSNIPIDEIAHRKYDIHKLNSYLQQRMDFLARVSTQWPETGEYLFFYSDLIKGFFKQSLLLDKIIKDDGVNGERIQFCLKINNSPEIWFFRNGIHYDKEKNQSNTKETNAWEFEKSQGVIPNDLLIQLPGGILGAHAFYIIIENIMRNSAKYNLKDRGYNIHIEIDQNENNDLSYKVRVFDNFSNNANGYQLENGGGCTLVQLLQDKLQGALIKETGKLTAKDWGIQEIKVAAQFLNYPFKEKEIGIKVSEEEFKYIWVEEHERNGQKLAGYVFSIPKARLILCADYPSKPVKQDQLEAATRKGVFFTELNHTIDAVSKWSPEILYFEVKHNDTGKFRKVLELLSEHRYFLPTRIVASVEKAGIEKLYEIYKEFEGKFPPRRLIICPSEEIKKDDWEKFIINVYKQWVFRWHKEELMTPRESPVPVKVGIVIYFKRSENEVFSRWSELKKELPDFGLDNIKMCFYSTTGHKSEISDFSKDNHSEKCDVLMGFDNHGNIRENFNKWDFYQILGHDIKLGMNNHTIFDSLTNITTGFGGTMFLLSLIETAFTKVAIVDERVANATFEKTWGEYSFKNTYDRQNNIINSNLMISASIWDNKPRCRLIDKGGDNFKLWQEGSNCLEGISETCLRFFTLKDSKTAEIKEQEIDVLVFHLGFLEESFKNRKEAMKTWLKKLSKKVSKIVLISGRGFKPEEIPHNLPFREASLITNHIISDFSKLHLVKGLISARGKKNDRK